ncbi:hypothetical protein [Prochlorococcus sp. MIT 0701]|uniref:hypothetical protein n=1 Tax=Prochlorococcus sp. MIT 0701 TaxID=1499502 RepID=UPI0039B019D2
MNHIAKQLGIIWRHQHRFIVGFFCLSLTIFFVATYVNQGQPQDLHFNERVESLDPQDVSKDALKVTTGLYLNQIYDYDPSSESFAADGWLWMKWQGDLDGNGQFRGPPINTLDFMNQIVPGATSENFSLSEEADDWKWQGRRFASRFVIDDIDYSNFPFETINLEIQIGTDDKILRDFVLLGDNSQSFVSNKLGIPGYQFKEIVLENNKIIFSKQFGHEFGVDVPEDFEDFYRYSQVNAILAFQRIVSSSLASLFIPLIAALFVCVISLFIDIKVSIPKITLPASILLILAVQQDRWRQMLPESIDYLTYMDKIYLISYIITVMVFVESLLSANRYVNSSEDSKPLVALKIAARERRLASILLCIILSFPFLLWKIQ